MYLTLILCCSCVNLRLLCVWVCVWTSGHTHVSHMHDVTVTHSGLVATCSDGRTWKYSIVTIRWSRKTWSPIKFLSIHAFCILLSLCGFEFESLRYLSSVLLLLDISVLCFRHLYHEKFKFNCRTLCFFFRYFLCYFIFLFQ